MAVKGWLVRLAAVCFLATGLAACGGGGGGNGGAKTGNLVDPAPSYKGASNQAVVTSANAEALTMGGYAGGAVGNVFGSMALGKRAAGEAKGAVPVLDLVRILKQSVRRMDLPQQAALLRKEHETAGKAKRSDRAAVFSISGDNGGTASYSLEVNDADGSYFGTVVYQGFSSGNVIFDGTVEILGSFDTSRQQLTRLTFSFKSLVWRSGGATFSLTGSLSWAPNYTAATETLSMNVVLLDQVYEKTYWFNNYQVSTTYSGSSLTQTFTGRYYDHDHGYVELSTPTPLVAMYGNQWPSQGALTFSGRSGCWIRLSFLAGSLKIEADTDGLNGADWQTEQVTNVAPPINSAPVADAGPD